MFKNLSMDCEKSHSSKFAFFINLLMVLFFSLDEIEIVGIKIKSVVWFLITQ